MMAGYHQLCEKYLFSVNNIEQIKIWIIEDKLTLVDGKIILKRWNM